MLTFLVLESCGPETPGWLETDDIMLTGTAKQEATSASKALLTRAFLSPGAMPCEDSDICRVSNIFRDPVIWDMLRQPPK